MSRVGAPFHASTQGGALAAACGVAEAVELARALNQLPAKLIVYGIEGKTFHAGAGFSLEVEGAAAELLIRVREDLCTSSRTTSPQWARHFFQRVIFAG